MPKDRASEQGEGRTSGVDVDFTKDGFKETPRPVAGKDDFEREENSRKNKWPFMREDYRRKPEDVPTEEDH